MLLGRRMPRHWDLLVFDWDGTVMDSTGAIVRAAERAIADTGLPHRTPDSIREIIGLGLRESWDWLFPDQGMESFGKFVESYRTHFVERERPTIRPYPGVENVLAGLRDGGAMLAVATGKSRIGLDHDLEHSGLAGFFEHSVTVDETRSKPHPEMLVSIISFLGVEPARTLMIGDTEFDLQMAHAAGTGAVGVAWGAHDRSRLADQLPLTCLDRLTDLPAWLKDFEAELDEGL